METAGSKGAVELYSEMKPTPRSVTRWQVVSRLVSCVPKDDLYLSEVFFIFNTWLNS